MKAFTKKLVLENGREFCGYGFGADREVIHEIVFNTAVVGYQEIMSDPAYTDQMVVMTYPLIGNYGMADDDYETKTPTLGAMIVREYNDQPSNFRYTSTLDEVLQEHNIPAIWGLDTRALVRVIRDEGTQKAILTDITTSTEEALAKLKAYTLPTDSVARVSCKKRWMKRVPNHTYDVVAIDCGLKNSVVSQLNAVGCNVTVLPVDATVEQVMAFRPDGVIISSGPGDPHHVKSVISLIKQLRGRLPLFGIGLGHQLIA
ncbi:MAG: carbamoyl phosphate synthase small subunit, partial [Alistipes sp.]|nr:carbamoyl phosphate synthase small subunit [Alistipes sp.]